MNDAGIGWTDERVELLARLWSEGLSASQIAGTLGGGVTRNAVIGKVHRLGLSGRVKAGTTSQPRAAKPTRPPARPVPISTDMPSRIDEDEETAPDAGGRLSASFADEGAALAVSERVSIMDLRESMCRWPIGDPAKADFGFCGQHASVGMPYCTAHCRIAYQPAADRRRLRA